MTTSKKRAPGPGWTELPQILRDLLAPTQRLAREYGPVVRVPIGRFHVEVAPGVTVRPRPSFALRTRDGVPVRLRAL